MQQYLDIGLVLCYRDAVSLEPYILPNSYQLLSPRILLQTRNPIQHFGIIHS